MGRKRYQPPPMGPVVFGEGSPLFYFKVMRTGVPQVHYNSLRQFFESRGWLNGDCKLGERIGSELVPLTGSEMFKLIKKWPWLDEVLVLAEKNQGFVSLSDLAFLATGSSAGQRRRGKPGYAVRQALELYLWIWTAEKVVGLKLVMDEGNYFPPLAEWYMPPERGWVYFRRCTNHSLKEKVKKLFIRHYLKFVRKIATRLAMGYPRSVELCDLISSGCQGLMEVFERFEPERGIKFETYAAPRIRGAILDDLRGLDWVPRSTRKAQRNYEAALLGLMAEFGIDIKPLSLVAERMGIEYETLVQQLLDIEQSKVISLDELVYPEDANRQTPRIETLASDLPDMVTVISKQEVINFILEQIRTRLTTQQRLVAQMYYWEELTLKQIAEVMEISESRVSQIHTKTIRQLRQACDQHFGLLYCRDLLDRTMNSVRIEMPFPEKVQS